MEVTRTGVSFDCSGSSAVLLVAAAFAVGVPFRAAAAAGAVAVPKAGEPLIFLSAPRRARALAAAPAGCHRAAIAGHLRGGGTMWVCVHGVESDAVTLAWEKIEGAQCYEVQLKEGDGEFTTVSDKLSSTMVHCMSCVCPPAPSRKPPLFATVADVTAFCVDMKRIQVRKKNMQPGSANEVRVRAKTGDVWGGFSEPVVVTTLAPDAKRIDAPIVVSADSEAITLSWAAVDAASTYSVEMRADCESQWTCVTNSLKSPAMRKKNLQKNTSYFFRVKPNVDGDEYLMSLASPAAALQELSPQIAALVGGASSSLVNARGETITAASLAGKVVAFYCSASWCGPCRSFTPRLTQFYNEMKRAGRPFEVVFMSCDRDAKSFSEYLSHMPWSAVPWDAPVREQALGKLGVQGIPMLAVMGSHGQLLESNAVQKTLSPAAMDSWQNGRPA